MGQDSTSSTSQLIQAPAIVDGFKPMKDRSWKITFETRELSGEEVKLLADNFQGEGFLVFKPNSDINPSEIPEGIADAGVKSPSQRVRSKLYILWKQRGEDGSFENFYRDMYQRFEDIIDSKLEPKED